jgi:hypothetical protein
MARPKKTDNQGVETEVDDQDETVSQETDVSVTENSGGNSGQSDSKTLDVVSIQDAKAKVSDIKVVGNGDLFKLLCKASSADQGWMKSSKAMQTHNGCIVQVTTQQKNPDGSYSVAEALTFVPSVNIVPDENGGNTLGPIVYN